jgi:Tfp pilus assembly protein PilX
MKSVRSLHGQRGIALPVMLIILLVMLVSSIYLLKSSNSTTLTTANLAYDASLSRAADLGLYTGFQWLSDTATANKSALDADDHTHGYVSTLDTTLTPSADGFWDGALTITDATGTSIDYVVHRICSSAGPYDDSRNRCVQTAANTATLGNKVALGDSLASDSPSFAGTPQVHYVVTSRIHGARGGNVVNQMVVLIGA